MFFLSAYIYIYTGENIAVKFITRVRDAGLRIGLCRKLYCIISKRKLLHVVSLATSVHKTIIVETLIANSITTDYPISWI